MRGNKQWRGVVRHIVSPPESYATRLKRLYETRRISLPQSPSLRPVVNPGTWRFRWVNAWYRALWAHELRYGFPSDCSGCFHLAIFIIFHDLRFFWFVCGESGVSTILSRYLVSIWGYILRWTKELEESYGRERTRILVFLRSFPTFLPTSSRRTTMILPRQSDVFFEGDGTRRVLICDKVWPSHPIPPISQKVKRL